MGSCHRSVGSPPPSFLRLPSPPPSFLRLPPPPPPHSLPHPFPHPFPHRHPCPQDLQAHLLHLQERRHWHLLHGQQQRPRHPWQREVPLREVRQRLQVRLRSFPPRPPPPPHFWLQEDFPPLLSLLLGPSVL